MLHIFILKMFIIALLFTDVINCSYFIFLFLFNHQVIQGYILILKIQSFYIKLKSSFITTVNASIFQRSYCYYEFGIYSFKYMVMHGIYTKPCVIHAIFILCTFSMFNMAQLLCNSLFP